MTDSTRLLALTEPWWNWPQAIIRDAIEKARLRIWLPVVRQTIDKNAQTGRHPTSFRELDHIIGRNARNMARLREGRYILTNQIALGLAVALELPIATFFPATINWLAETVLFLCAGQLSETEARAYAAYRLAQPVASNPHLDPRAVRAAFAALQQRFADLDAVERAIDHSADVFGGILEPLIGEGPS